MGLHAARNIYLDTIYDLVSQGEDIVLVSSDLAAPSLDKFRRDYPLRYVSVGIAEQNLISVACGIALSGKRVIAYSANPFTVLRAFDQIRNLVSLMNIPISIVGVGAGFSIPEYGATHFSIEDIGLVRMCSNIEIINVSDETIGRLVAHQTTSQNNPLYIRFDKLVEGTIYSDEDIDFFRGFNIIKEGTDIVVITTGYFTESIMSVVNLLEKQGISVKLIDVYKIPIDKKEFIKCICDVKCAISIEEHVLQCGLGTMILEILSEHQIILPINRIGINLEAGYPEIYGDREYLLNYYGLDNEKIFENIVGFYKKLSYER